ncbi:MAG TPA: DUF4232 domain-containing protein [Actinospica sp.]|nr:DUF4232 domain-containing protein [Actinospica sp.]
MPLLRVDSVSGSCRQLHTTMTVVDASGPNVPTRSTSDGLRGSGMFSQRLGPRQAGTLSVLLAATALTAGCASNALSAPSTVSSSSSAPRASAAPSATGASTAGATRTVGQSSRCRTGELAGSFAVVPNGHSAGHTGYNIRLTDVGGRRCTVYGFPGLQLLDAHHAPVPTDAHWGTAFGGETLITLSPGGSASATAYFSPDVPGVGDNTTEPSPGASPWTCQPVAAFIEITPPDETTHLIVPVAPPTPVCSRGSIYVSPFVAGTKGPNQP